MRPTFVQADACACPRSRTPPPRPATAIAMLEGLHRWHAVRCRSWREPQIAIARQAAPAPVTSRDFVPGRFSDVRQPSRTPQPAPTSEKPAPTRTWTAEFRVSELTGERL